jgi:hypothetical protein
MSGAWFSFPERRKPVIVSSVATSLVLFSFAPDRYIAPTLERLGEGELSFHLARVAEGARPRFDWPWLAAEPAEPNAPSDPLSWLAARTERAVLSSRFEGPLAQCVRWEGSTLVGRYIFDHHYSRSHPEVEDPAHRSLAHGTIAAKLFDDGVVVLTDEGVRASLAWRSARSPSAWLSADGRKGRR